MNYFLCINFIYENLGLSKCFIRKKLFLSFISLFVRYILSIYSVIYILLNFKDRIINKVKVSMYYVLIFFMFYFKKKELKKFMSLNFLYFSEGY